ncbi:MAG: hypothetical protein V3V78_03540 [Candidatus Woesearchaeota archaeon]
MPRKKIVYDPQEGIDVSQLTREHPTMKRLRPYQRKKIDACANDYLNFLNKVNIATDVVDEVGRRVEKAGFGEKNKDFFMTEREGTAFAMIGFGKKPLIDGLRLLYSHTDAPCLQAKVKPLHLEWDPDLKELHLGVEIDTHGYGGILSPQWGGRNLRAVGWSIINGRRKKYDFDVHSAERAQHTDPDPDREHREEFLDVVSGHQSKKSLLKAMGLKRVEDFVRTRLYFVPDSEAKRINDYFISGYGQDCRIGIYSSVEALLQSKPKYTTIVLGFDKEEVGSGGIAGAKGNFLERVINKTLMVGEDKNLRDITVGLRDHIYYNSLAINADVDVGSTHREEEVVDKKIVGKLGYGTFISGTDGYFEGDQVSPYVADKIMTVFERRGIIYQTIGNPCPVDEGSIVSMNEFFVDRGIPTINVGVVLGSLHSTAEISHIGDLHYAIQGYKAFIEDPVRKTKKRR